MDTLISKIDVDNIDMEEIKKQAEILRCAGTWRGRMPAQRRQCDEPGNLQCGIRAVCRVQR